MQVNVNVPKSKSFNVYLRMFQLGLRIALAYWAIFYDGLSNCNNLKYNLTSYLAYAMILLNLLGLIVIRCSDRFPRCCFFLTLFLNILLAAGIIALAVIGYQQERQCASNKAMFEFSLVVTAITLFLVFLILCFPFYWGQRYTNAPGNFTWAILFLQKGWTDKFYLPLLIIGLLNALVSFLTLLVNLMACNGITTKIKKILQAQWIIGLLILIGCEIYACITYFTTKAENFQENQARKLLAIFILVNFLDILFWLWGMKTLAFESGDQVRDDIYAGQDNLYHQPRQTRGTGLYGDDVSSVYNRGDIGSIQ